MKIIWMLSVAVAVLSLKGVSANQSLSWFGSSDPSPDQAAAAFERNETSNNTGNSLKECDGPNIFQFQLSRSDDANNRNSDDSVEIVDTIVVDGCQLDCKGRFIPSSVSRKPAVVVRNGGMIENCVVNLLSPLTDDLELPSDDDSGGWIPSTGYLCDSGGCTLNNVSCQVSSSAREKRRLFSECILIETDPIGSRMSPSRVQIQGGRMTDNYSAVGIKIQNSPYDDTDTELINSSMTSVSIEDIEIRYQEEEAILIIGGPRSVRISNVTLSENGNSGVRLNGGNNVEFLSVLGSTIRKNGGTGISVFQYEEAPLVEIVVIDTKLVGNAGDGALIRRVGQVTFDDVVASNNGDDGIDIKLAADVALRNVLAEGNDQNGFACSAYGAVVNVAESTFRANGNDRGSRKELAGVFIRDAYQAIIMETNSRYNEMDGYFLSDIQFLLMTDVDAISNGSDGFQIQMTEDGSGIVSDVSFARVSACSNKNDGIDLRPTGQMRIKFSPLSQVTACSNGDYDFVRRGGVDGVAFVLPSGEQSGTAVGLIADSCRQYPGKIDCYDANTFVPCNDEVCLSADGESTVLTR